MKRLLVTTVGILVLAIGLIRAGEQDGTKPRPHIPVPAGGQPKARPHTPRMLPAHAVDAVAEAQTAMVKQYCVTCHNDRGKAGGLSLASFDAAQVVDHVDLAEKMVRKLRAGMMPPPGAKRPEGTAL